MINTIMCVRSLAWSLRHSRPSVINVGITTINPFGFKENISKDFMTSSWPYSSVLTELRVMRGGLRFSSIRWLFFPQFYWSITDLRHCVSSRCTAQWSDLHIWYSKLTPISSYRHQKRKKYFFFLAMRTQDQQLATVYPTAKLTIVIVFRFQCLVFIYLITGHLCLWSLKQIFRMGCFCS